MRTSAPIEWWWVPGACAPRLRLLFLMGVSHGKVLLAMSGGVDSSVAAALLLREGYEVVGCFMRLGSPGEALDEMLPASEVVCNPVKIGHQGC